MNQDSIEYSQGYPLTENLAQLAAQGGAIAEALLSTDPEPGVASVALSSACDALVTDVNTFDRFMHETSSNAEVAQAGRVELMHHLETFFVLIGLLRHGIPAHLHQHPRDPDDPLSLLAHLWVEYPGGWYDNTHH